VIVDVTESQIERPKKQINYYSGKKKKHTLKTQVIFSPSLNQIISKHRVIERSERYQSRD
jgi:hypothetical protein